MIERPAIRVNQCDNIKEYLQTVAVRERISKIITVRSDLNRDLLLSLFFLSTGTNANYPGRVLDVIYSNEEQEERRKYLICRFDGGTFVNSVGTEDYRNPTLGNIHQLSLIEMYMLDQLLLALEDQNYLITQAVLL